MTKDWNEPRSTQIGWFGSEIGTASSLISNLFLIELKFSEANVSKQWWQSHTAYIHISYQIRLSRLIVARIKFYKKLISPIVLKDFLFVLYELTSFSFSLLGLTFSILTICICMTGILHVSKCVHFPEKILGSEKGQRRNVLSSLHVEHSRL